MSDFVATPQEPPPLAAERTGAEAATATPGKAKARFLLGWVTEPEATQVLLGRAPTMRDDLAGPRSIWDACRANVEKREAFDQHDDTAMAQDLPAELAAFSERLRGRNDVQPLERLRSVALGALICVQRGVDLDPKGHSPTPPRNAEELWNVCMPPLGPTSFSVEHGKRVVTFSSANPNLRILSPVQKKDKDAIVEAMAALPISAENSRWRLPSGEMAGFYVGLGSRLMRVVRYNSRYFLTNGYHRSHFLVQSGITRAPCLVSDARSAADVIPPRSGFFSLDVIYGPRPPFVRDFLDSSVSVTAPRKTGGRKVVRIVAEEFTVYDNDEAGATVDGV